MTDLTDRVRLHEAPHIRHIDVQTLDALLRIEELLVNLNEALAGPRGGLGLSRVLEDFPNDKPDPKAKNKKNSRQL
jgi:hypothetical protein